MWVLSVASNVSRAPRITVSLGASAQLEVQAVADSAADRCLLDASLARAAGCRLYEQRNGGPLPALVSLSGLELPVLGVCFLKLGIGDEQFKSVRFVVARDLPPSHRCILGNDFLAAHGAVIDMAAGSVSFSSVQAHPAVAAAAVQLKTKVSTQYATKSMTMHSGPQYDAALDAAISTVQYGDCADTDRRAWSALVQEFRHVFAAFDEEYGSMAVPAMHFDMADVRPWRGPRNYKVPYAYEQFLDWQVASWLAEGRVSATTSDFNSPIFPVEKPHSDGKLRAVVDLSELNKRVLLDAYMPPTVQSLVDRLGGSTTFCTFDLQHAFLQIGLAHECRKYTAFTWRGRQYAFNYVPFGLSSAPLYLQRILDEATAHLRDVKVYADDVLVHASGPREAIGATRRFFEICSKLKIKLKPAKCKLGFSSLTWLGRTISADGVSLCQDDVEAVEAWPAPTSRLELQSFLGKLQWIAPLIPALPDIMAPLLLSRQPRDGLIWGPEQQRAFIDSKRALQRAMALTFPVFDKPFIVEVDASRSGFGAFLLQDGKLVRAARKATTPTEAGLQPTQLELAALVWAVKHFDQYLRGTKFTVISDHRSLQWLRDLKHAFGTFAVWRNELENYDFTVKYRPGILHGPADALSRSFKLMAAAAIDGSSPLDDMMPSISDLRAAQEEDAEISGVKAKLDVGDDKVTKLFTVDQDGLICQLRLRYNTPRLLYWVPYAMTEVVLRSTHDRAAHNKAATMELLKSNFYWKDMLAQGEQYCKRCLHCQQRKSNVGPIQYPRGTTTANFCNDIVAIDITSGFMQSAEGFIGLAVIQDYFSRFRVAVPIRSKSSAEVARAFESHWIGQFGAPRRLLADNGAEFEGAEFASLLRRFRVARVHTAAYRPQSDGMVENSNRWIADAMATTLKARGLGETQWPAVLTDTMLALNSQPSKATGFVPFYVFFGRPVAPLLPLSQPLSTPALRAQAEQATARTQQVVKEVHRARALKLEAAAAAKKGRRDFKKGDNIMVYLPRLKKTAFSKLASPWIGPCQVLSVPSQFNVVYKLLPQGFNKDIQGHQGSAHITRVKPWHGANADAAHDLSSVTPMTSKLAPVSVQAQPAKTASSFLSPRMVRAATPQILLPAISSPVRPSASSAPQTPQTARATTRSRGETTIPALARSPSLPSLMSQAERPAMHSSNVTSVPSGLNNTDSHALPLPSSSRFSSSVASDLSAAGPRYSLRSTARQDFARLNSKGSTAD